MTFRLLGIVMLATGLALAQSMLEHAAAATGGTIGAAGGKKVSEGITKILNKTGKTTASAGETGKAASKEPLLKVGVLEPAPETAAPAKANPTPARRASVRSVAADIPAGPAVASQPPAGLPLSMPVAPPLPPTPEKVAAIPAGASRDDVVSALGAPAARISMYEDGRFVEIYRYSNGGSTVGAVRLANGAVETVTPVRHP